MKQREAAIHKSSAIDISKDAGKKNYQISKFDEIHHEKRYLSLRHLHSLQEKKVRNCMHNVLSPLSAISGYVELMNMNLSSELDTDKIKKYSGKISDGLNEISELLGQLQGMYSEDGETNEQEISGINVNLIADEVTALIKSSSLTKATEVKFLKSMYPVYVKADLFQLKLVIYNLIYCIDEFANDLTTIVIQIEKVNSEAVITFRCDGETEVNCNMINILSRFVQKRSTPPYKSTIVSGLIVSSQIADQISGEIRFISEGGENPRFLFTIPLS
jgi:light-regulated signal transduction histidine kinase (bacteriophytochrome)